ncbi:NACHT domain-containing protein [Streptomyces sp. NPDC052095]|uniref:NACHT domain-containing protein n=1 Tax=unclassified Streptomyces TaxID=2593676 RepID=UPI00345046EF
MQQRRLALVKSGDGDRIHSIGTGYLIAPRLVLTARHVVQKSHGSTWERIEVRVGHPQDDDTYRSVLRGDVCWTAPDGLDAALLLLDGEVDAPGEVLWGRAVGSTPLLYEGLGYPYAAYKDRQHKVEHLRGELPPLSGGTGAQDLYALDQGPTPVSPADGKRAWGGASGTAVFCQDRLVGVVIHDDEMFADSRLHALPVLKFATEPTFVEALQDCGVAPPALADISAPPVAGTGDPTPSSPDPRALKLRTLGRGILAELDRDPVQKEMRIEDSLPIRCRAAPEKFTGKKGDTRRVSESLASTARPDRGQLLNDIAAFYLKRRGEKLLVLGQAGSGKSVLIRSFAQMRLNDTDWIEKGSIPVIFSLGSWNPDIELSDWLIDRLERDHPSLSEQHHENQRTWAAELIENGDVLAILDGFDEMAKDFYGPALKNIRASRLTLLLTSRPEAIESIQEGEELFPGIELTGLTLTDYKDQLGSLRAWRDFLDRLDRGDTAATQLANALSTPLMFAMAEHFRRSGGNPTDLMKLAKDDPPALQGRLFESFLRRAYSIDHKPYPSKRQRWSTENAQKWLGYLATHLTELSEKQKNEEKRRQEQPEGEQPEKQQWDAQDIEWWQLGTTMSLPVRAIVSGVLCGLVSGTVCVLVGFLAQVPLSVYLTLFVNGLGIGIAFGVVHGVASKVDVGSPFKPFRIQIAIGSETREKRWRRVRKSFLPRTVGGLIGGLTFGIVYGGAIAIYAKTIVSYPWLAIALILGNWIVAGPLIGLGMGIILSLMAWFEREPEPNESTDAADRLRTNRTIVLVQASVVGLALALGYGAAVTHFNGRDLGLQNGIAAGLAGAFGVITLTAWGRWVILVRFWLPLMGRLPWRVNAFLDESWDRGVLHRTGAVYQFRHAKLRDHLSARRKKNGAGAASPDSRTTTSPNDRSD